MLCFLLQARVIRVKQIQLWVSCHVGSIHLRIPSVQLRKDSPGCWHIKNGVLTCFILMLDEDEARNTAVSRETMTCYTGKMFEANVIKPWINVIGYS